MIGAETLGEVMHDRYGRAFRWWPKTGWKRARAADMGNEKHRKKRGDKNPSSDAMKLQGVIIKSMRERAELTQREVATLMGVSTSLIGQWEIGAALMSRTQRRELGRVLHPYITASLQRDEEAQSDWDRLRRLCEGGSGVD